MDVTTAIIVVMAVVVLVAVTAIVATAVRATRDIRDTISAILDLDDTKRGRLTVWFNLIPLLGGRYIHTPFTFTRRPPSFTLTIPVSAVPHIRTGEQANDMATQILRTYHMDSANVEFNGRGYMRMEFTQ